MDNTKKLIELVKQHPCLYDYVDKNYKNNIKKNKIWEKIGSRFNVTGEIAKMKWKNLRDYYVRYKKTLKSRSKKEGKWTWLEHLQFLDAAVSRYQRANQDEADADDDADAEGEEVHSSCPTSPSPSASSPRSPPAPPSPAPSVPSYSLSGAAMNILKQAATSGTPLAGPVTKRRFPDESCDTGGGAGELSDQTADRKPCYDAVEYLFLSYAETFKSFSEETQIEAKLKLANLFAETELKEYKKRKQTHSDPLSSGSYVIIKGEEVNDNSSTF